MERLNKIEYFSEYGDTFLTDWIREEMRFYGEPDRKGRKRGELIGHSWIKRLSCYMNGTLNLSHKQRAKQLKVSYSTMRIWSTEELYRKISEQACEKFANEWVKHVNELRQGNNPPSQKICKKKFADSALYSDCIITRIIHNFFPKFEFETYMARYTPQVLITALQLDNFKKDRRQEVEQNITKEFLMRAIEFYTRENYINLNEILSEESTESSTRLKDILSMVKEYLQE